MPSLTALFTFVARDPVTKRAMAINQLVPQSPEEIDAFAERKRIADARKAARQRHVEAGDAGTPLVFSGCSGWATLNPTCMHDSLNMSMCDIII